jgi:hypothetical protein
MTHRDPIPSPQIRQLSNDSLNTLYPLADGTALYGRPVVDNHELIRAVATLTHQVQALQERLLELEKDVTRVGDNAREEFQQISDWSVATDLAIANLHENQVQYNNALSNVARRDSVSILFSRQATIMDRLSAVEVACVSG